MYLNECRKVTCITFNQDYSYFIISTRDGFTVFNTDTCKEHFHRDFESEAPLRIVEPLFKSCIFALVREPMTTISLWHDSRKDYIAVLEFRKPVRGVRLRRDRIIAILDTTIFIYTISTLVLEETLTTGPNHKGIAAINTGEHFLLACPGAKEGQVLVHTKEKDFTISAHKNALQQVALNKEGTLLATASNRGTVVRLWNLLNISNPVREFRRGSQQALIYSLAFNMDSTLLCLSSNTGTIHIFSLRVDNLELQNKTSMFSFVQNLIPITGSTWSSKQLTMEENRHYISCFINGQVPIVIAISASGTYYRYIISDETESIYAEHCLSKF